MKIKSFYKMINKQLKEYIDNNILTKYNKYDLVHGLDHIYYVIERSLKFANSLDNINKDMVYTIAAYHDLGYEINAKMHEIISAKMLKNDKNLTKHFTNEQIDIMSQAVKDHRASMKGEPETIYGKIVSSADRNTSIDMVLIRAFNHKLKTCKDLDVEEIIQETRNHIISKFGKDGYANNKMYFKDEDYKKFLKEILLLVNNYENFKKRLVKVNNL